MSPRTKYIIAGLIGVVTITGALAYVQYKKLMEYAFKFKGIKVRTITKNLISFDAFMLFTNNSNLIIHLEEQEFKVYLNDQYVTRLSNGMTNIIKAKGTSEIGLNVAFDPTLVLNTLKLNWVTMLIAPEKTTIKIDGTMKVKVFGFVRAKIPYTYTYTLKELL